MLLPGLLLCVGLAIAGDWNQPTPLDHYVNRPDPTYSWVQHAYHDREDCETYVINMTSQTWKDHTVTDHPVWQHHLVVGIPKGNNFTHKDAGFLWIGGGSINSSPPHPDGGDFFMDALCSYARDVGVVTGYLRQIPNQPFTFKKDPLQIPRTEDSLIAFTWRQFIENTSDPEILLRMPMTKASVRAMDTMNAVANQRHPDSNVTKFMVSGGSKRGWTAWTVGCVDRRVVALAPVVMTMLNLRESWHKHFRSLGGWSYVFQDYYFENLTQYLDDPRTAQLETIVDPYAYRARMTMPKIIVCATGDEFFLPDDSHLFFDDLVGEKYMLLMENTHHGVSLSEIRVYDALRAFYKAVLTDFQRPSMSWTRQETDNQGVKSTRITLTTSQRPRRVEAWAALSDVRTPNMCVTKKEVVTEDRLRRIGLTRVRLCWLGRDFRWATVHESPRFIFWEEYTIIEVSDTEYYSEIQESPGVFTGLVVNALFDGPDGTTFDFTTEISVVPDTFPHPRCSGIGCWGTLV